LVTDSKTLKLLLVEDDPEDEQLLSEALIEVEERREWCNWRGSSIVQAADLATALDCLRQERFDAILLNLSLPDSPSLLDSFLEVNACARATPILVLADEDDENLSNRLLREGVQDILVKGELECAPLARSVRYAVERERRTKALRSSLYVDTLTGTLSRQGFLTVAGYYVQLSRHIHAPLLSAILEIQEWEQREQHELVFMRLGETLRGLFQAPSLVGRLDRRRFGVISAGLTRTTLEALLNRAAGEIEQMGVLHYSVNALGCDEDFEALLGTDGEGPPMEIRQLGKTVMLAD
jgi:PleD family two-component response regulator